MWLHRCRRIKCNDYDERHNERYVRKLDSKRPLWSTESLFGVLVIPASVQFGSKQQTVSFKR